MRPSSALSAWLSFVSLLSVVGAQSPEVYEEMANEAASSGNYVLAAQNYAVAADAYAKLGNHSAAAVNHERAASIYAALGSTDLYLAEAVKAAASYGAAGSMYLDQGNYWYAANAFARSAAFYNATGKSSEYREMEAKSGDAFMLMAGSSPNLTGRVQSLYRASVAFYGVDNARFENSKGQLESAVVELKAEAVRNHDEAVFDVLEVYYLPLYYELLEDDLASAKKMGEVGELASLMGYYAYAASYHTSAAAFYDRSGRGQDAIASLQLVADMYTQELRESEAWNYTGFLGLKDYLETDLYVLKFLNRTTEVDEIASTAVRNLNQLASGLIATADGHKAAAAYEWAASNYSAAAEVLYILGDEETFRRLNGISGSMSLLRAQDLETGGNSSSAADAYDGAAFLLKLAGNESYKVAYGSAARLHASLGNQMVVAGNLTLAAGHLFMAARDFRIAGDPSAATYYEKYIALLWDIMPSDAQTSGMMLMSIGDAQWDMGDLQGAIQSYGKASDQLVQILSSYLATSPEYLASIPALPKNLAKAYRLSGRLYLARSLVKSLDSSYMYSTLGTLASFAEMYGTVARVHGALAQSDMSVYDFQSNAVNKLFCGITAMIAGNDGLARSSLQEFESLNHPLHSANRKFYELLKHCLAWVGDRNQTELAVARSILSEILSVSEDSDTEFLLQDLDTFLLTGADPTQVSNEASSKAAAGDWKDAGDLYYSVAVLRYFREEFNLSLSAFEDSSYMLIKSGDYAEAGRSAERAYECSFEPTEFTLGLRSLSQAFLDANRTLAGMARASFKRAAKLDYKPDKSRELMKMAAELEGIDWPFIFLRLFIAIAALLCVLAALVIIRRRSHDERRPTRS